MEKPILNEHGGKPQSRKYFNLASTREDCVPLILYNMAIISCPYINS
jgi:hypothetical protein